MITTSPSSAPCGMPATSKVSPHVSPQPTPAMDPLSLAFTPREISSTSAAETSASLSASSNSSHTPSAHSSLHDADDLVTVIVSRAEWANLRDSRRRSQATSALVTRPADLLSHPEHEPASAVCRYPSISLPRSPASVTRNTATIPHPSPPQPSSHLHAQPSRSLDPFLNIAPSLLSLSFLSAPSRHSQLLRPPPLSNMQLPSPHMTGSSDDPVAETAIQLAMRRPANEDEVD
ncbi:hypothetical protein BDN67DRAFT_828171 [Paxillus ammoniavirescens]|nr:hypothetical protein BDN67DRAFT_828171 [Paxillus ammoniavirescens]